MAEVRKSLTIVNAQGLHARPCHAIVSTAMGYPCELRLVSGDREVNGKSILELMTLQAAQGTELEVRAWGQDADGLVAKLVELFAGGFGEAS